MKIHLIKFSFPYMICLEILFFSKKFSFKTLNYIARTLQFSIGNWKLKFFHINTAKLTNTTDFNIFDP